jgi:hypothetical protein
LLTSFPEKLRLKGRAEEDTYFARRDRELIAALHRRKPLSLIEVRSGGQTGVDRGALDAVLALPASAGIRAGGWCPRGRRAEDGVLDARYPLVETPASEPEQRTEWNVRDADATLVLHHGDLANGTALTAQFAARLGKPLLQIDLNQTAPRELAVVDEIRAWLAHQGVRVLNVAGPRESQCPGITAQSRHLMQRLLTAVVERAARRPGDAS